MDGSGLLDPLHALWPWVALVAGLVVGSFANVCIHRLPERHSVVTPRSRCPQCGTAIRAMDNVPVLSYLALGGRCRACRAPISARYPLVEAANAAMYFALARARWAPRRETVVAMALVTALLVLSLIDYDHQLLPDAITLPGIALGAGREPASGLAHAAQRGGGGGGRLPRAAHPWPRPTSGRGASRAWARATGR